MPRVARPIAWAISSFFQVNRFLIEALIDAVIGTVRGRLALDLFAGVGLFTVALTKQFERVIGVESNLAAAKDLETNLETERRRVALFTPHHRRGISFPLA